MEKRELVSDYHLLCVWEWLSVYVYVAKTGPPLCYTIRKMVLQARERLAPLETIGINSKTGATQ